MSSFPYVFAITSGASDEPPIPQRITFVKSFERACALRASSSGSKSREVAGRSIQFSLAIASFSALDPQSEASLLANRRLIAFKSFAHFESALYFSSHSPTRVINWPPKQRFVKVRSKIVQT